METFVFTNILFLDSLNPYFFIKNGFSSSKKALEMIPKYGRTEA